MVVVITLVGLSISETAALTEFFHTIITGFTENDLKERKGPVL